MERYPTNATAFSFTGATKRILRWTYDWRAWPAGLGWISLGLILGVVVLGVASWYLLIAPAALVWVPWRVVRRQHREQRRVQAAQLAALEQVADPQQWLHRDGPKEPV